MNSQDCTAYVNEVWDATITPTLIEYIKIPNKSPAFDPDWEKHGYMDQAVEMISGWCKEQDIPGLTVEVVKLPGRTPLIYMEVPGDSDDTVMLYGHLDKQPEMTGWNDDLGPWKPVMKGDKLYGRGGADDGYAAFASLTAINALKRQKGKHARCVILIEGCEESGSFDLPFYIDHLAERIGKPSLVICLDSGCGNYEQMWCTTSLRGLVSGDLEVEVLREGVHSGDASGVVPSSFRVLRQILNRIENVDTGVVHPDEFNAEIPAQRVEQAEAAAQTLGDATFAKFPWVEGMRPAVDEGREQVLNRTWRPALSITGVDGVPGLKDAGNVLRPFTSVKISLRVPPTTKVDAASAALKKILEADPPYGAKVTFTPEQGGAGWNAPAVAKWLDDALTKASQAYFGAPSMYMGEGGSIPFMGMLGEKFPEAQFMITGVLGPASNAHGPNEFLHIPCAKKLTCCVAQVLEDHFNREA